MTVYMIFKRQQRFYSTHMEKGCYRVAVPNLLLLSGDSETARKFFDNYPSHDLVGIKGKVMAATAPRILRDLTDGAYDGIVYLYYGDLEQELWAAAKKHFWRMEDRVVKAAMDELAAGNIRHMRERTNDNGQRLYMIEQRRYGQWPVDHWTAPVLGNDLYIDNGMPMGTLGAVRVTGVLDVRKNGKYS